jgi:broad specificity phosphatase PhoE
MALYLIRHGQSEFNAAYRNDGVDPMIFDARLTQTGWAQAKQARAAIADLGIKLVITSPLTRAIETAVGIFDGIAPIKIMAEHREHLAHSCDVGRTPEQLQKDFPKLSFDHLDDIWWHQGPLNAVGVPVEPHEVFKKRIAAFVDGLHRIDPRPVAIIGHGDTFREMSGHAMENCEIRRFQC